MAWGRAETAVAKNEHGAADAKEARDPALANAMCTEERCTEEEAKPKELQHEQDAHAQRLQQ